MRALRFLFLTIVAPLRPEHGLPLEEAQAFATAWLLPGSFALREGFLPQRSLSALMQQPSRALCAEAAVGLWSAQQHLCEQLSSLGVDARGLPPVSGRALEAFFLPSGRFWLGAYCPAHSLGASQEALAKALGSILGAPPRRSMATPFPWLPEFGRGGSWALGATQSLGSSVEMMGPSGPSSST